MGPAGQLGNNAAIAAVDFLARNDVGKDEAIAANSGSGFIAGRLDGE
jgi:hypothetical protein